MNKEKSKNLIFFSSLLLFLFNFLYFIIDINNSYWMFGDQTRDWRIASKSDIQLVGTSISSGGNSLGPIFYWILQLTYHVVGPFFDYLPHSAVYGQSFFYALTNSALFYILAKKYNQSIILLVSLFIFYITSPMLASLAGTSWNPNYSAIFINLSLVLAISKNIFSDGYDYKNKFSIILFLIFAWFSVQSHSPALFYFLAAILFIFIKTKTIKAKVFFILSIFFTVLILQIPYLINIFNNINEVNNFVENTGTSTFLKKFLLLQGGFGRGFIYLMSGSSNILLNIEKIYPLLIIYILLGIKIFYSKLYRDSLVQFFLTYILITYYGFSCIPSYDRSTYLLVEHIFLIAILPLIFLMNGFIKNSKFSLYFQFSVLILSITFVPHRFSQQDAKFEFYGKLVEASRNILKSHPELNNITTPQFQMPIDALIIYEGLGGKINPNNKIVANVDQNGNVTYNFKKD